MTSDPLSLDDPVRLIRRLAHDVRGPIATVAGSSDMLIQGIYGELNDKQLRACTRIQRSGYRLLALLDDITTYVKAEAGEYPLNPIPFEPRVVLTQAHEQTLPVAVAKELDLHLTVDEKLPPVLVGDPAVIARVLLVLIWNAIGFTEQGDVWVEAALLADATWDITVRDSGPGIPSEYETHIFEPFLRGQAHSQVPTPGAGLGLAMAQALMKELQGTLSLEKTGPEGSSFRLTLPLKIYQKQGSLP